MCKTSLDSSLLWNGLDWMIAWNDWDEVEQDRPVVAVVGSVSMKRTVCVKVLEEESDGRMSCLCRTRDGSSQCRLYRYCPYWLGFHDESN